MKPSRSASSRGNERSVQNRSVNPDRSLRHLELPPRRTRSVPSAATIGSALAFAVVLIAGASYVSVPTLALALIAVALVLLCFQNTFIAAFLLLVSMLFSPEITVGSGVRLRGEDLLVPVLAAALLVRVSTRRFGVRLRTSPLDGAIVLLLIVNVISSVRGYAVGTVSPLSSLLWNLKILELFLIYWITFNYVRDPDLIRRLMFVAFLVLVLICGYAALQIPGTEVHTTRRLTAPFEGSPEPTTLGGYLTFLLCVLLAMAIYEPSPQLRIVLWVLSGAVLLPILFTLSRTTYVMCIASVLLLSVLTRHLGLLLTGVSTLALAPLIMPGKIIERVLMTFDSSRVMGLDSSAAERIDVWRKAAYTLEASPLLGFGVPQSILDSQFVRIIAESGLLGLLAWLTVLLTCILLAARLHRRATDPRHKAIAVGYLVGTVGLVVHAFAAITFYIVRIMEPFWFVTGIVASLDAIYARTPMHTATTPAMEPGAEECVESAV